MNLQLLLIEHDDVRGLWPFSATHCSWELRCGHFTMLERWKAVEPSLHVAVSSPRERVEAAFRERHPQAAGDLRALPTLVITAHALLSVETMRSMLQHCTDRSMLFRCHGESIAIYLPEPLDSLDDVSAAIEDADPATTHAVDVPGALITNLWDVFDHVAATIRDDASLIAQHVHPTAVVHPSAVIDVTSGPVLIDADAIIGPLAVITGPCSIGRSALVKPHAALHTVVVGPVCKVAGEIEDVVLQGYANKQHGGFLGHSYLCEWTNLGAGTITSDLMNTYGPIIVSTPWGRVQTDRMFLGLLMGDHAKTAIGTLFMTGTLVGVCANVVGQSYPARQIPSYMWKDMASPRYGIEKALAVVRTVMARRDLELGPATETLLRHIHTYGDA